MVTFEDTSGSSREDPGLDSNLEPDSKGREDSNWTDSDSGSGLTGSGLGLVKAGSAILCSALQLVIGSTAGLINLVPSRQFFALDNIATSSKRFGCMKSSG